MNSTSSTARPPDSRIVRIDGKEVFELIYCRRSGAGSAADRTRGVSDDGVIEEYANAIQQHYVMLCGNEFQWRRLSTEGQTLCRAVINDLGSWMMGAAMVDRNLSSSSSSLTFTSRCHEATVQAAEKRRRDVVLHELVHLLQFETDTWRYWPLKGRWGISDPNWWLHEAVALAVEAELAQEYVSWSPWLWTWATMPHLSLESDRNGALAAPFLCFLIRKYGHTFPSSIYRLSRTDVPSMRGTDLLARAVNDAALSDPEHTISQSFGDVYLEYCTQVGYEQSASHQGADSRWRIVGTRMRTEYFEQLPVDWKDDSAGIDHLGCRYFQLDLRKGVRVFVVRVNANNPLLCKALFASVTLVNESQNEMQVINLTKDSDGMMVTCCVVANHSDSVAILTVANASFGSGRALSDGMTFQIRIESA